MYSQRDPRYAHLKYGPTRWTIGQKGCLLCNQAKVVSDGPFIMEPPDLNRYLLQRGGYNQDGGIVFDSFRDLRVVMSAIADWRGSPANLEWIDKKLQAKQRVLLEVNFTPYGVFSPHWVLLVDWRGDDLYVYDPWVPASSWMGIRLLSYYGRPEWMLERAIYRAVSYYYSDALMGTTPTVRLASSFRMRDRLWTTIKKR